MAICPKLNLNSVINSIVDDVDWCESFGTAVGGHGCEFIKTCPVYAKLKMHEAKLQDAVKYMKEIVTDTTNKTAIERYSDAVIQIHNSFKEAMQEMR